MKTDYLFLPARPAFFLFLFDVRNTHWTGDSGIQLCDFPVNFCTVIFLFLLQCTDLRNTGQCFFVLYERISKSNPPYKST